MILRLTRKQVRRVDQLAMERYGMASIVLMENAGRNASQAIVDSFGAEGTAMICCGNGNNGGDGLVIARHLHNAGWAVRVMMVGDHSRRTTDTAVNLNIVREMGIHVVEAGDVDSQRAAMKDAGPDTIVVDALLGTGFQGDVRSPVADLIRSINAAGYRAVVAVDIPSGLDCDSGAASSATVRANLTVTFVAEKVGFAAPGAEAVVGRVVVVGIGAPRELIHEVTKA